MKKLGTVNANKANKNYIESCLLKKQDLIQPTKKWGFTNVLRCCVNNYYNLFLDYIVHFASLFTKERKKICINNVTKKIFGLGTSDFILMPDLEWFYKELNSIIDDEYFNQCKLFISDNHKEMATDNEVWVLYFLVGPGLNSKTFDFTKISCPTIRKEVMLHLRNRLWNKTSFRVDTGFSAFCLCMNFITEKNKEIRFCSDIQKDDVVALLHYLEYDFQSFRKENIKPSYIKKAIEQCSGLLRYFVELSDEGHPLSYPLPRNNPFDEVSFHNIAEMEHNTDIIPDIVMEQLEKYEYELNNIHQLISAILKNTGMRVGEAIGLDEGCVDFSEEYDVWVLKYKLGKNLNAKRKKAQSEHNIVVIPEDVALLILEQEQSTKDLRKKYNIKNIFINDSSWGHRHALTNGYGFVQALNRIAKKHQIADKEGKLWHFTSRQYRKKVAVDMIENNATPHELARQFGHNNTRTGKRYYAQIRKAKLADLNHKFFEKKFNLIIGDETLRMFSEEERKALYVDFCLDTREVELGVCTKHFSVEPCGKRTGKTNCASCKNICTGPKYLPKWILLRDSQKGILDELIRLYETEGIKDYAEYREYERELYWYNVYSDAVKKIIDWKESHKIAI